jgi:hypothetical protein
MHSLVFISKWLSFISPGLNLKKLLGAYLGA